VSPLLHAPDEAAALEELHRLGCTDGLPVVIPTPARVERMVLAAVEDPTTSLGVMGPLDSATTIEKVAINTVMAGCDPDHMPIVVATLRALLRPEYDLFEAQSTTHSTTPLVVISGPLAASCGIAGGFGALGGLAAGEAADRNGRRSMVAGLFAGADRAQQSEAVLDGETNIADDDGGRVMLKAFECLAHRRSAHNFRPVVAQNQLEGLPADRIVLDQEYIYAVQRSGFDLLVHLAPPSMRLFAVIAPCNRTPGVIGCGLVFAQHGHCRVRRPDPARTHVCAAPRGPSLNGSVSS